MFVSGALRELLADENFVNLLRASFPHFVHPKDESRPDSSWVYNT